jgi:hypothetical protein
MKIPIRVTLKSPQVTTSFTILDEVVDLPSPNDQFIFSFDRLSALPCRVSHTTHFCGGGDAACLIMLDRILLDSSDQYLVYMEGFSTLWEPENVEHIEEENDALYQRMCELLDLDLDDVEYELATPVQWQDFAKLVAETFRCLLVTEVAKDVKDVNLSGTNSAVLAVHNAILDNKDRNSGRLNLRQMLIEFDQMINPECLYSWSAPLERIKAASETIYQKVNINHTLGKSTV